MTKWNFRRDGFAVHTGLFDAAEVQGFAAEARRLHVDPEMMSLDNGRSVTRERVGGGQVIDRLDPVADVSAVFGRLAVDDRMMQLAAECVGGAVMPFKDKLIFKAPGAHGYEIHQDFTAWQEVGVDPEHIVSLMVAIDDATEAKGAIDFYPGLHGRHLLDGPLSSDIFSKTGCVIDSAALDGVAATMAQVQAGDVVAIHSLVPHSSSPNLTDEPRAAIFLTYALASYGSLYEQYYEKFRNYRLRSASISGM